MAHSQLHQFLNQINTNEWQVLTGTPRTPLPSTLEQKYIEACQTCGVRPNALISQALGATPTHLDVSCNYLGPLGCAALLPLLPHLGLTSINFSANMITSELATSLALVLRSCSVTSVDLSKNRLLSFHAGRALLTTVHASLQLTDLNLNETNVPQCLLVSIADACTYNREVASTHLLNHPFPHLSLLYSALPSPARQGVWPVLLGLPPPPTTPPSCDLAHSLPYEILVDDPIDLKVMSSKHHHPLTKPEPLAGPQLHPESLHTCVYCVRNSPRVYSCPRCRLHICASCYTPMRYCLQQPEKSRLPTGVSTDMLAFHRAVRRGNKMEFDAILHKWEGSVTKVINFSSQDGLCFFYPPPLITACYYGRTDLALSLIRLGASLTQLWYGFPAERWARLMGHHKLAYTLYCHAKPTLAGELKDPPAITMVSSFSSCGKDVLSCILEFLPQGLLLIAFAVCTEWQHVIETSQLLLKTCVVRNQPVDQVYALTAQDVLREVNFYGVSMWPEESPPLPVSM
eukprot:NODE_1016_length_1710_cov_33.392925_g954_i0.p1 GENE.NODE_1016_length_1710_cov_33.392925_g954_i0~~NODE_1016_length_1710_cov_33.392925_g954_i0.p1  ORF type:complete len:535 (+),score=84.62 NODE_1016_length_1710_cov_33.392925_g954_i0:63-1607(+)